MPSGGSSGGGPVAGEGRVNVVCFGQQNWHYCWTGKQQLLSRMAARGHRVLYVDPTWLGTRHRGFVPPRAAGSTPGLQRVGPGDLHVLTYEFVRLLRHRGNVWRWPRVIRRTVAELGMDDPVSLALRPPARELVERLDPRGRVYYAVDEHTAFGDRTEAERRRIRAREEAIVQDSDLVLGVSPRLHARFRTLHPRSVFLPNGADLEHFSPETLAAAEPHPGVEALEPGPVMVFVGQVDDRMDQALLRATVRRIPDLRIVLAGRVKPGTDVSSLEAEPRIHLLGYVPYADLPSVLGRADVCAVPYVVNELTRSCNPLKVFEYLATGLPVVSTPLDALEWCSDVVRLAADHDAFADQVEAALHTGEAGREARLARARAHGWSARVDELEARLEEAASLDARRRAARGAPPDPRFDGDRMGASARAVMAITNGIGRVLGAGRSVARRVGLRSPDRLRILVVRRTRLGDLVVFLPTLRALRAHHPRARIELAVQPEARGMVDTLLEGTGLVDAVITLEFLARPGVAGRIRGAVALAGRGYDLLVTGAGYSLIRGAFFCGAPRSVGVDDGQPLQRHLSRRLPLDPFRHEAENHLALMDALGGLTLGPDRAPRLPAPSPARTAAARARLGLDERDRVVIVHAGAQKPSRRWPAERFRMLVEGLLRAHPDRTVFFTGTGEEVGAVEGILEEVEPELRSRARSVAGGTDLPELMALLGSAALVVCGDTGILHLARALGRPLLALLGPENDQRWGPHPAGRAPATALRHPVPCAPCKRWDCPPLYCLRSLSVDAALVAAEALLDGVPPLPVRVPAWARGHGEAVPRATEPEVAHGVDARREPEGWAALAEAGHAVPRLEVRLHPGGGPPGDGPGGAGGGGTPSRDELARRLGWPERFLRAPGSGPEEGGLGTETAGVGAGPEVDLVLFAPRLDRWSPERLHAEVAALVREPGLALAGRGGWVRVPGGPLPPDVPRDGFVARASALDPRRPTGDGTGPGPDELHRLREAVGRLPGTGPAGPLGAGSA